MRRVDLNLFLIELHSIHPKGKFLIETTKGQTENEITSFESFKLNLNL